MGVSCTPTIEREHGLNSVAGTWVGGNTISTGRRRREPREESSFLVNSPTTLESVRLEIGWYGW